MGEEDNKNVPQLPAEMLSRLDAIEKDIAEMAGMRKKQLWINIGGAITVLVVLAAFVGNLFDFARTYDTNELLAGLQTQGEEIINSPQTQETLRQMQAEFVPLYRESLIKEFNRRGPEIRKNALLAAGNLEKYLRNDARVKVEKELTLAFANMEKELLKRYPGLDLTAKQIETVFNHGQTKFLEECTRHVQNRVNSTLQELAVLQAKFNQFKDDPEYRAIKNEAPEEIQSRLIEAMLELWIFNLNPSKGNRVACTAGGNK